MVVLEEGSGWIGIDDPKKGTKKEEKRKGREKGQKSKVAEEQGRRGRKKCGLVAATKEQLWGGKQKIVALAKELSCSSLVPKSWKLSLPTVA